VTAVHVAWRPDGYLAGVWVNGKRAKKFVPRTGCGLRDLYRCGSVLVKIGDQAETEAHILRTVQGRDRRHFPELLAAGDDYVAVRWVPLRRPARHPERKKAWRRVLTLARKYGIADMHSNNWGLVKGVPFIVDCGIAA
jgi:hypothetical protein